MFRVNENHPPPPQSFFNGFQEFRKSNSGKTGVDMSTPVHAVATPLLAVDFRSNQLQSTEFVTYLDAIKEKESVFSISPQLSGYY